MDMQEGVLLGVCRGCVCSREWIPRQVSLGGVNTLARIRVTATREKWKGNCTRPGMDRDPLREQPDYALHVLYRPHSIFLPNEPLSLFIWKTGVAFGSKGTVFNMSPDRAPPLVRLASERFFRAGSRPGRTGGHLPQRKQHCRRRKLGTEPYDAEVSRSGYLLELRPTTTGPFRFGATPYSTIIIGVWGSRQRKIKAAYQFFLYTLLGSVFMLLAILLILLQTGTTDLQISLTTEFSERRQIFLWIASFASFAVKVPMVPVHIWLPEAHVEAPTAGSVILAGIPLKLGTYGFLRFSIPMFPEATLCSTPFIYTSSAIAIIYTSSTTLRQIDLKKIIAYSPVAHMNLVTIGMFSRAAAVRSPILSYGHTRPKHVCRACDPSTY
ncbi:hypothetical protein RJ640_029012 [Escallonia rubra]|uniref:NADH-ubiquinone oxidoreductase chain 4 n=1 Tax=Escallonia rubra TaxID=112253 RepID=A0AA88SNR3_9ASTE|nr:hypothetical protein RJ640_029012 [Escallonia rubra]